MNLARLPVVVTDHALQQARERANRTADEVVGDVRRALLAGRVSELKPEWLVGARQFVDACYRRECEGVFVWNAARTVAYVIAEGMNYTRPAWRVITCLTRDFTPDAGPTALQQAFRRAGLAEEAA